MRCDKKECAGQRSEDPAEFNDFRSLYCIAKEFAYGCRYFVGHITGVNGRFLIHNEEQLKRRKEYFTKVLNRIRSIEFPPIVGVQTFPPIRRKIISAINELNRCKATGLSGVPAELFIAVS